MCGQRESNLNNFWYKLFIGLKYLPILYSKMMTEYYMLTLYALYCLGLKITSEIGTVLVMIFCR